MAIAGNTSRRLLLIDDDAIFRHTVGSLLRDLGHKVLEARSGAAGLAILRQLPVDLVMTDLSMPGLMGWAVAQLAKAMRPHLPVVLLTGEAHLIPLDLPERRYVDAVLAKPCRLAEIQAVVGLLTRDGVEAVGAQESENAGGEASADSEACAPGPG